ncbi:MAG: hypothetical protein K6D03_00985 [Solobacterium sp.]|nr:hypothetical protein [Solobacterium sp.]
MDKTIICPHCGSSETEEREKFYFCRDCSREFGRDKETDDGEPLADALIGIRLGTGDHRSGSLCLRIAYDAETDTVVYEVYKAVDGKIQKNADVLENKAWNKIKNKLINECFVADWDRYYYPVNDGSPITPENLWRLDLIVGDDRQITFRGYDAFPPHYKKMMALFKPMFDQLKKA